MASATEKNKVEENNPVLNPTVFHEPWWLHLACGQGNQSVKVEENGRVVGILPYFFRKQGGFSCGTMPPMTHFLGPAIDEGDGSADTRHIKRMTITRELIGKLPRLSSFVVKCHGGVQDAIAFQLEGFRVLVQFTHEILPADEETLWQAMHHKKRSVITRAQKRVKVEAWDDVKAFISFYRENLSKKGIENSLDLDLCEALANESLARGAGVMLAAKETDGALAGAIFCVKDARTCYYFMTTRRPGSHTGVISLLIWEAIKKAASEGLVFDFDGLLNEGSVKLCADFGARISPRYICMRETWLFRFLRLLRTLWKEENFFLW